MFCKPFLQSYKDQIGDFSVSGLGFPRKSSNKIQSRVAIFIISPATQICTLQHKDNDVYESAEIAECIALVSSGCSVQLLHKSC